MSGDRDMLIYLVAGEPSGDVLGAGLIRGLRGVYGDRVEFTGVGGDRMAAAGMESLFPMAELSVMGLAEVLPRLPGLLRRIGETAADVARRRPAALVTIDSPDFSFRVAKKVKRMAPDVSLIHLVAPTVWAWRPGRAKAVAAYLDHLLCLLPFEPPFFAAEGLPATFIGHPLAAEAVAGNGPRFRAGHDILAEDQVLAVLPGSRMGELQRLLPIFGATVDRLHAAGWRGRVVIPTLENIRDQVHQGSRRWPTPPVIVTGDGDKADAFAAADAALAASGTVVLELARAKLPSIVAYKVNAVSAALGRRLIKVRHVGLINILLDREVMPEFLQEACRPDDLAAALGDLLGDPAARMAQKDACRKAIAMLRGPDGAPTETAARTIAHAVGGRGGPGEAD